MAELSEELIAELKEAFSLFDKDADNIIKTSELPLVVRSLNQNPTEAELEEMTKEVDPESTGLVNFADFVALVLICLVQRKIIPSENFLMLRSKKKIFIFDRNNRKQFFIIDTVLAY